VSRLDVRKTYKLFIGGAFPRSESGRTYEIEAANVARASRKDVRDAVRVAREAQPKWGALTAYNRGQVLYRVAEMLEGRRDEFAELTGDEAEVDVAVDTWVWYAGWADKLAQVIGSSNPVSGPYFNFTIPEPTGVVGSERRPLAAITLAEVLATSDVPGGAVNVLTGRKEELCPVLAAHMDVNAIDLAGVDGDRTELERLAAENVKRVIRNGDGHSPWHAAAFLELKTVWHPIGA
jgi:acyl-CoA reductase-like NAD-dependent aldehyde dehydrogenase